MMTPLCHRSIACLITLALVLSGTPPWPTAISNPVRKLPPALFITQALSPVDGQFHSTPFHNGADVRNTRLTCNVGELVAWRNPEWRIEEHSNALVHPSGWRFNVGDRFPGLGLVTGVGLDEYGPRVRVSRDGIVAAEAYLMDRFVLFLERVLGLSSQNDSKGPSDNYRQIVQNSCSALLTWVDGIAGRQQGTVTLSNETRRAILHSSSPIRLLLHVGMAGVKASAALRDESGIPTVIVAVDAGYSKKRMEPSYLSTKDILIRRMGFREMPVGIRFHEIRLINPDPSWISMSSDIEEKGIQDRWVLELAQELRDHLLPNGRLLLLTAIRPEALLIHQKCIAAGMQTSVQTQAFADLPVTLQSLVKDTPLAKGMVTIIRASDGGPDEGAEQAVSSTPLVSEPKEEQLNGPISFPEQPHSGLIKEIEPMVSPPTDRPILSVKEIKPLDPVPVVLEPFDPSAGTWYEQNIKPAADPPSPQSALDYQKSLASELTRLFHGNPETMRAQVRVFIQQDASMRFLLQKMIRPANGGGAFAEDLIELRRIIWDEEVRYSFDSQVPTPIERDALPKLYRQVQDLGHILVHGTSTSIGKFSFNRGPRSLLLKSFPNSPFWVELRSGIPLRIWIEDAGGSWDFLYARNNQTGDVLRWGMTELPPGETDPDEIVFEAETNGSGSFTGHWPLLTGKTKVSVIRVGLTHPFERIVVLRKNNVVMAYASRQSSAHETELPHVIDWRTGGRPVRSFGRQLPKDEFELLRNFNELRHLIKEAIYLSLGGQLLLYMPGDDMRVDAGPIVNAVDGRPLILGGTDRNTGRRYPAVPIFCIYTVPSGVSDASFRKEGFLDVYDGRFQADKLREEKSAIVEAELDSGNGMLELMGLSSAFPSFPGGRVEVRIVNGEKRYARFLEDNQGNPILTEDGLPVVQDLLASPHNWPRLMRTEWTQTLRQAQSDLRTAAAKRSVIMRDDVMPILRGLAQSLARQPEETIPEPFQALHQKIRLTVAGALQSDANHMGEHLDDLFSGIEAVIDRFDQAFRQDVTPIGKGREWTADDDHDVEERLARRTTPVCEMLMKGFSHVRLNGGLIEPAPGYYVRVRDRYEDHLGTTVGFKGIVEQGNKLVLLRRYPAPAVVRVSEVADTHFYTRQQLLDKQRPWPELVSQTVEAMAQKAEVAVPANLITVAAPFRTPPVRQSNEVRLDMSDGSAVLTLTSLYAEWTIPMAQRMVELAEWLSGEDGIRLVVVNAEGARFGVGGDLQKLAAAVMEDNQSYLDRHFGAVYDMARAFVRLGEIKPVVTMAHGTAVGAHLALGMAGILAVSLDAGAQYGFPEIRAGLSPEAMATYYLSRRIGLGPALYMALTGALISGAEARASGLADAALALADLSKVELNLRQWVAAHPGPIRRRDVIEALRREEPPYVQTSENTGATILEDLLASPPLWETLLQHLEGLESARSSPLSALAASILRDWEHFFAPALYVTHKLMRDHMAIPFEVALRTERDILRRLVEQSPFPVLAKQMLWPPNNHRPAKSREHLHQLDRHLIAEIFGGA